MKYLTLIVQIVVSLAFILAGGAKLMGADMMVQTFDQIGMGQWFRYVTGLIEVGAGLMLWLKGLQFFGAALLVCTMIGAVTAHVTILGPSALPAVGLGVLSAFLAWRFAPGRSG